MFTSKNSRAAGLVKAWRTRRYQSSSHSQTAIGVGNPSFCFWAQSLGIARSAALRRAILVWSGETFWLTGSVDASSKTFLSRKGTRLSSEWAMAILSVFSRMSPASQKAMSTRCMRVTSSSSATSA